MKPRSRYHQFCPVAKASEVFAEPWTPLVLRELLCGSHRFSELHKGVPRMSQSLLAQRLRQLEDAGLVTKRPNPKARGWEYYLTEAGEETRPIVMQLGAWGQKWVQAKVTAEELDASLLMWDVQRHVVTRLLPKPPFVMHFHFPDAAAGYRRFWMLWDGTELDTCLDDPGRPVDLTVRSELRAMTLVWLGELTWEGARRQKRLELIGPRDLQRQFPHWLQPSTYPALASQPAAEPAGRP